MALKCDQRNSLIRHTPRLVHLMKLIKSWGPLDPEQQELIETLLPKHRLFDRRFSARESEILAAIEPIGFRTKRMHSFSAGSEMEQKHALGRVFDDKVYLERLLVNEYKRMRLLFSRTRRTSRTTPLSRLWLQLMLSSLSDRSETVRNLAKNELLRISEGCIVSARLDKENPVRDMTGRVVASRIPGMRHGEKEEAANAVLDSLWKMYISSQYVQAVKIAVHALQVVEKWPGSKTTAVKWRIQADLCHLIGLCLDGMKKYKAALHFFQMDARLAEHADILPAKKRALDNVGRMHAILGHYKEAIACWSERLNTRVCGEELAWLLYQLALCHTMLDNFNEAEQYCVSCTIVAESVKCTHWTLSGHLLRATVCALSACRAPTEARMLETSLVSLDAAYKLAVKTKRSCVMNAVLSIIRTVHKMIPVNLEDSLLGKCWSSGLLELLKKDTNNRANFDTKVLRDMLLRAQKTSSTEL